MKVTSLEPGRRLNKTSKEEQRFSFLLRVHCINLDNTSLIWQFALNETMVNSRSVEYFNLYHCAIYSLVDTFLLLLLLVLFTENYSFLIFLNHFLLSQILYIGKWLTVSCCGKVKISHPPPFLKLPTKVEHFLLAISKLNFFSLLQFLVHFYTSTFRSFKICCSSSIFTCSVISTAVWLSEQAT